MSDSLSQAQGADGLQRSGTNPSSKKRPKITFIDPSEWANLQTTSIGPSKNEINQTLQQRLVDRQSRVNRIEETEPSGRRPRKKIKHQRSRRGRPRKRPIDPRRPWIESDDEEDDYIPPGEDDSDDEAFLERLAAEKEREEAEERRRKQEMQRLRQQKREERRYRATGRPGRPRTQVVVARLYANSNEDAQSSKASEVSDNEVAALDDVIEEDQVEDIFDLPPPPCAEDVIMMEEGADLHLEPAPGSDFPRISSIVSRRKAPPLFLPPSSRDIICPPQYLVDAVSIYEHLRRFGRLLKLSPFRLDDFLSAIMANENSGLLSAIHIALLKALIKEDENNGTHFCPPDCKDAVSLLFGYVLDQYTWPYILSLYLSSVKSGEMPALEALAHVGNSAALAWSSTAGTLTASGGTDSVVTTSLFFDGSDCVVPLDPSYPFVSISQRLAVLRGLIGLFLGTGAVRADVLREGMMAHDDFCRVCRLSGELLCCATCPAVFHLTCLTPPLESVPQSQWWCPLCVEEHEMYGDKKIPKSRGEAKILPLGYDRAGRVYWHLEGRLFVEPSDFAQREPKLPGLMEGIRDEDWEKLEADDPTDDLEDFEDTNSEDNQSVKEEGDKIPEDTIPTDPHIAYANEPPVYYYSSLESIYLVRQRLSTKWERGLCANFDNLIVQLEKTKPKTEPKEEGGREVDEINTTIKEEDQAARWPKALSLLPSLNASQLNALFANSQLAMSPQKCGDNNGESRTPAPMEIAFLLDLSGGILIHNQDGLFENFPIPPEIHSQRVKETCPALVDLSIPPPSHLEPLSRWRRWRNTLSEGVFVPNPTIMGENGPAELVNIALTRPEQHDEREKHRSLANKFCLSDAAMAAWKWLNAETTAEMIHRATVGKEKPLKDDYFLRRRADAVGPQRWLHTMKLTLCYMESLLPSGAMCPAWRMLRRDWIEAVLRSLSVFELTDLLGRLEASIRQVSFLRTWMATMGPLQLDRFTSAQREEEKRKRALERVAAAANAVPTNLVRTKTVQPVPHTVWKTRGEEYRRLGGDGWQWCSSTRRKTSEPTRKPLRDHNLPTDRPPYLGLGWGVQPELLSSSSPNIVPSATATLGTRKTVSNTHPITGVQISQNVPRMIYRIPRRMIQENSEFFIDGVIDISKCLREGDGKFYPVLMKSVENESKQHSFHHRRAEFRLDSLLALRIAADERGKASAESASIELAALKQEREELFSRTTEIQSRLSELATKAQEARSEHARAVKARQTSINETKAENERQLAQSRGGANPMRRPGSGGGGGRDQQTPASRNNFSVFRPPAAKRVKRDEVSNFDSSLVASGAESDESRATSSSKPGSSNAESSGLRRSSRRQKTKSVDPDFVMDFCEDDEEEEEEEFGGEKVVGDDEDDGDVMDAFRSRGARVPQFDGAADDDGTSDEEVENFGVDENNDEQNHVTIKIGDTAKVTQVKSVSVTPVKTIPITPQVRATTGGVNPVGKSLLALAIEGKTPQIIANQSTSNGASASTESNIRIIQAPSSANATTVSTNISQGPMRLVRVLNSTTPSGASVIRPAALTTPAAPMSGNLIIPASTDSALQKSLIQLSSSSGVIVTQASQLPAGYRLITPSSLPTAPSGPRQPLNIVQVLPSTQVTASQQLFRPRQPSTASSLITIAPSPVPRPQMRPLLPSPFSSGGVAQQKSGHAPRMVRMVTQPMQLDPRLDEAVIEAANKQYGIDMEIFNLRKELYDLESKLAELKARIQEREDIVTRGTQSTAKRYSLNPMDSSLLKRLNRAAVARCGNSSEKYMTALQKRHFVHLPSKTPQVNPYAWPPDALCECRISSSYPQNKQATSKPVPNLFRLSRSNLKFLIRHAGRVEIPGYDAEKKRLTSINWIYPTSRPCFAEAWRYRLRQIIIADQSAESSCGSLNTPSHYGVSMANFATHLRLLWHSLRWDEITMFAARCDEATLIDDRYFLKLTIPESHGGGYTLRRVVGVKPLDPYWLRANFLVETTTHKSPVMRKRPAPRSNNVLSNSGDGGSEVTKTPGRRGRRPGKGNSKGKADPDYDPAADEGWRVGIPCSARSRRSRRLNYNENFSDLETDQHEDGVDEENEDGENGQESSDKSDSRKTTLEWTSEENLELWEIRNFFDSLLPLDTPYPPSVPRLALEGIPQALVEELSPVSTIKEDDTKDNIKQLVITKSSEGRWIQPSCLLPPESLRPPSPKPPSPPAPLPPPPNIVVMESAGSSQSLVGSSIAPSIPLSPSSSFRPLIVSSNRHPTTLPRTAQVGTANRRRPPEFQMTTPSIRSMQQQHQSLSQPKRPNAPLSPNTEAARARARSLAASHAARISAANRRFRNERAAVENRVSALLQEMDNRRRLTVKFLALQVQEEVLQSRKPPQPEETTESIPTPSSSVVTAPASQSKGAKKRLKVAKKAIKSEKDELAVTATPSGDQTLHQVKPASSRKRVAVGRSSKLAKRRRRTSSAESLTPSTEPCTDSDETLLAIKLSPEKKKSKKSVSKKKGAAELQSLQPQETALKRRTGRSINISGRGRGGKRLQASPSPPHPTTNENSISNTVTAGRRTRGQSKTTTPSIKARLPIRTPRYLLDDEPVKAEHHTSNSLPSFSPKKTTPDTAVAAVEQGKLYCLCRKPHNPNEAYIGCDLCQDWFHFTCVGLNPDTPPEEIGESWLCPECRKAEAQTKDEVYCVCRTPYNPSRVYIACDRCDEWYHPECVNMKPEDAASLEGSYICPSCSVTKASSSSKKSSRVRKKPREKQAHVDNVGLTGEEVESNEISCGTIYETPLTEPIKKAVEDILVDLSKHKLAWPIMERLPLNVQTSPLQNPIDLNSFKAAFEKGDYKSLGDVSFAGNRLFSNARSAFEVGSNALHCVEVLESFFVHRMKEVRALTEQHQQQGASLSS
nr:fetal alzheimer antigen falz [Hymenolepis microstoma]